MSVVRDTVRDLAASLWEPPHAQSQFKQLSMVEQHNQLALFARLLFNIASQHSVSHEQLDTHYLTLLLRAAWPILVAPPVFTRWTFDYVVHSARRALALRLRLAVSPSPSPAATAKGAAAATPAPSDATASPGNKDNATHWLSLPLSLATLLAMYVVVLGDIDAASRVYLSVACLLAAAVVSMWHDANVPKPINASASNNKSADDSAGGVEATVACLFADARARAKSKHVTPASCPIGCEALVEKLSVTDIENSNGKSNILLFGPPGTGKTELGRYVAGLGVLFVEVTCADVYSRWAGDGARIVRELFRQARLADEPVVLFLDEVHPLVRGRADGGGDTILSEFLTQTDGPTANNKGVVIIATTNVPREIDPAARRRFARQVLVDAPNESACAALLKKLLRDFDHLLSDRDVLDCAAVAARRQLTGSVLKKCVEDLADSPSADSHVHCLPWFDRKNGEWNPINVGICHCRCSVGAQCRSGGVSSAEQARVASDYINRYERARSLLRRANGAVLLRSSASAMARQGLGAAVPPGRFVGGAGQPQCQAAASECAGSLRRRTLTDDQRNSMPLPPITAQSLLSALRAALPTASSDAMADLRRFPN